MTTIKSYTDLEQSKKLAEILPLDSADMYYFRQIDNDYFPTNVESICPIPLFKDGKEDFNYDIRCWSLAALLNIIGHYTLQTVSNDKKVFIVSEENYPICSDNYSEPVDSCYQLILKLNELNLL